MVGLPRRADLGPQVGEALGEGLRCGTEGLSGLADAVLRVDGHHGEAAVGGCIADRAAVELALGEVEQGVGGEDLLEHRHVPREAGDARPPRACRGARRCRPARRRTSSVRVSTASWTSRTSKAALAGGRSWAAWYTCRGSASGHSVTRRRSTTRGCAASPPTSTAAAHPVWMANPAPMSTSSNLRPPADTARQGLGLRRGRGRLTSV